MSDGGAELFEFDLCFSQLGKSIAKADVLERTLLNRLPDQPQLMTALARVSAQTTFEGAAKILFGELPADKVDPLKKELAKLVPLGETTKYYYK